MMVQKISYTLNTVIQRGWKGKHAETMVSIKVDLVIPRVKLKIFQDHK